MGCEAEPLLGMAVLFMGHSGPDKAWHRLQEPAVVSPLSLLFLPLSSRQTQATTQRDSDINVPASFAWKHKVFGIPQGKSRQVYEKALVCNIMH